jgi:2,3-bisphosphoglycerate-dependent phosphoglycerate mutase
VDSEDKDWRLNERHYGGLTGLDKAETAAKHGDEQVKVWRRSFDIPPPPLEAGSASIWRPTRAMPASPCPPPKASGHDRPRAAVLRAEDRPGAEGRRNGDRFGPRQFAARAGEAPSGISDADITGLEIPTGQPIVYELDDNLAEIERYYLSER